jgi:hypothetical protein
MRVTMVAHPDEPRSERVRGEVEFVFASRARSGRCGGQRHR